jgi:hypothetical protein
MLVLEKNQVAGLASAKIRRINIRKGYKDYHKKLPTKAAIVVIRRCFICLLRSSGGVGWFNFLEPKPSLQLIAS